MKPLDGAQPVTADAAAPEHSTPPTPASHPGPDSDDLRCARLKAKGPLTKGRLLLTLIENLGGPYGKLLRARFEQELLSHLKLSPEWDRELTEAEYLTQLAAMRAELPAFLHHLEHGHWPAPPPHWTATQN